MSHLFSQNDSSHYFQSFDNTKIYYEEYGTGFPVILLHGFLSSSTSWERTSIYQDLKSAGYRVIVPDLRGNGRSDKPHDSSSYADDAEAKDIILLAKQLKLDAYDIVGYSRGSIIAARLLVLDKRIDKAVLGGMGTDFTNPDWPRRKLFYRIFNGDTSVPELEPLVKRLQTDTSLDRKALTMQQKEQPSTPIIVLQKIKQPVLVICGLQDSDNGNAEALAKIFTYGKFASVPGDHGYAVTTKEFSEAALTFFSR